MFCQLRTSKDGAVFTAHPIMIIRPELIALLGRICTVEVDKLLDVVARFNAAVETASVWLFSAALCGVR